MAEDVKSIPVVSKLTVKSPRPPEQNAADQGVDGELFFPNGPGQACAEFSRRLRGGGPIQGQRTFEISGARSNAAFSTP